LQNFREAEFGERGEKLEQDFDGERGKVSHRVRGV
jgi:hypothetical protein